MLLYDHEIQATEAEAAASPAQDLTASLSESFDVALRQTTEWNNWAAYANAKQRALASYYDDVKTRTGEQLPLYGLGGGVGLDELNTAIVALNEKAPEAKLTPLSEADIDSMALKRMAKAHGDAKALEAGETTWGGTFGRLAGGLLGTVSDPVNVLTLPVGGVGTLSVWLRAIEFAGLAAGTTAVSMLSSVPSRERAVPGSSAEIPGEVMSSALAGAAFGGAFGLFQKFVGAGARPLLTGARDEMNIATSEAQVAATNVLDNSVAGEMAHRDVMTAGVRQALKGEPVTAGDTLDPALMPKMTPEQGERHLRPLTIDEMADHERFDPIPGPRESAEDYWLRTANEASPEQRAALGITDGDGAPRMAVLTDYGADLTGDQKDVFEAVQRNLDRLRVENPNMDYPMHVEQPDGSTALVTRRLEDVLDELDGDDVAARELMACATGLQAAE